MRVAAVAALLNLLGTSLAVTRNPSDIKLKWLDEEVVQGDTLTHMEITFADGSKDEIFLKPDPKDDCFFHGSLKGDVESEVEVDGCKNDAEIVEISSRLVPCGIVILLLENGETYTIDPTDGITFPNGTDSVAQGPVAAAFRGPQWQGSLPPEVTAKFHIRITKSLVEQWVEDKPWGSQRPWGSQLRESWAKIKVRRIVSLAQPWFKQNLGLAMDVKLEILSIEITSATIPDVWAKDSSGNYIHVNSEGDILEGKGPLGDYPTAWFTKPKNRNGIRGRGSRPAFCKGAEAANGLVTEVYKERVKYASSAWLFAHELGHNLGIRHDFIGDHGGKGGPCDDKGIMSYPPDLPMKWSTCSRKDQEDWFRTQTHSCMTSGSGEGGSPVGKCKCNGRTLEYATWIGKCGTPRISCGAYCFVNEGDCPDQKYFRYAKQYMSCLPCDQPRNAQPLKKAECPNDASGLIGTGIGILAAGLLLALI